MSIRNNSRVGLLAGVAFMTMTGSGLVSPAWADAPEAPAVLDAIIVAGSHSAAIEVGGSATYLDLNDIATRSYSDVNRVLRQVPGVHVREEDGHGLRPNISIRGSYDDRNSKIAIYEDGVQKAPAPYSAPAAYYFPAVGRMTALEVVKGAGAIKYGPHTAAGAVHFFSTPIPDAVDRLAAKGRFAAGTDRTVRAHLAAGGWARLGTHDLGGSVETYQNRSSGFKKLDNGGPTGFEMSDYIGKVALRSNENAGLNHALEFKIEEYTQHSNETYLGLTRADFGATPNRRYAGSQLDAIDVKHRMYQLTWNVELSNQLNLTTLGYVNRTSRVWYKLQDVRNAAGANRGLGDVLQDPTSPANASAYAMLAGADSPVGALRVRSNDRLYHSKGVQTVLSADFAVAGTSHALELSARYHADSEDRFQRDDRYTMVGGTMQLAARGMPGAQANQIDSARAWSFFVRDTIGIGNLTLTPGLRYESIILRRERYAANAQSSDRDNRGSLIDRSRNKTDIWIPGIGANFDAGGGLRLIAGVHRGFTNPAPVTLGGTLAKPEKSTNWEAGLNYVNGETYAMLVGYFNNYSNFIGTCTASTGGDCNIGDQFSGGRVHAKGIEASFGTDLGKLTGGDLSLPVSLVYTFTHATFRNALASFGPWGENVARGDRLPNLPRHVLTVNAGVGGNGWKIDIAGNYNSAAFGAIGTVAMGDPFNRIAPRLIVDMAGEIEVGENAAFFVNVENLANKTYNVGTLPSGWRPGLPRTVMAGLRFGF